MVKRQNSALIVCDMQKDALQCLAGLAHRDSLISNVQTALSCAQSANVKILYTGLRFGSQYCDLDSTHKLYGALKRINKLQGNDKAHWFMDGYSGTEITCGQQQDQSSQVFWRQSLLPSQDLLGYIKEQQISHVTLVGVKLSHIVLALAQALVDLNDVHVSVIEEAVADENPDRQAAILNHVLPIFSEIISLSSFVDKTVGLENYTPMQTDHLECCDCGRGGHAKLYMHHLKNYVAYPLQHWYSNYKCPLGKKRIDFCDEPQFSKVSMYIAGRENLDEKDKILELAREYLPPTFVWQNGEWMNASTEQNVKELSGPWFVKECDKNGGKAVQVYATISKSIEYMQSNPATGRYVVQSHIEKPLLTINGRKCHLKLYSLLLCNDDAKSWTLFTYSDAFLSTSPVPWNTSNIDPMAQITTKRHHRLKKNETCKEWNGWPEMYESSQDIVKTVVGKAIRSGKLRGRPGQKQFEIFSADFMLDQNFCNYLIEFNFGPVLFDPEANQPLATAGLREYQRLYEEQGSSAVVNDHAMIRDAIGIVFDNSPKTGRWEEVETFAGEHEVEKPKASFAGLWR